MLCPSIPFYAISSTFAVPAYAMSASLFSLRFLSLHPISSPPSATDVPLLKVLVLLQGLIFPIARTLSVSLAKELAEFRGENFPWRVKYGRKDGMQVMMRPRLHSRIHQRTTHCQPFSFFSHACQGDGGYATYSIR